MEIYLIALTMYIVLSHVRSPLNNLIAAYQHKQKLETNPQYRRIANFNKVMIDDIKQEMHS